MNRLRLAALLATSVSVAACGRLGLSESAPPAYEPLPAQPTAQVQSEALRPLPPSPGYGQPVGQPPQGAYGQSAALPPPGQPIPPAPGQVAMAPQPAPAVSADKARPLALSDLAGDWALSSGADNCRVTMSLTSWAGGRRAMSRGCSSPELQKISAWAIDGKQVILKGSDGSMVGSLYSGAPEQFAGTTVTRAPISLSR